MLQCRCWCTCCDTQVYLLPEGQAANPPEGRVRCPYCSRQLHVHVLGPFGEPEWLGCDDPAILVQLDRVKSASERKRRLFLCACCRLIWDVLPEQPCRRAVEVAERVADGTASGSEREQIARRAQQRAAQTGDFINQFWAPVDALGSDLRLLSFVRRFVPFPVQPKQGGETAKRIVARIRDIFGNPFRTAEVPPIWSAWADGTVVKLARSIYEDRAFERMPILGDALEEAGCTDEAILSHCRQAGEHVLGCWVVDAVLGRS
jgi:hypothetical protein